MPKLPKEKIQKQAQSAAKLSSIEEKVLSLATTFSGGSSDNDNPYVTLKYFRDSFECFSEWEKDELKVSVGSFRICVNGHGGKCSKQVAKAKIKRGWVIRRMKFRKPRAVPKIT